MYGNIMEQSRYKPNVFLKMNVDPAFSEWTLKTLPVQVKDYTTEVIPYSVHILQQNWN